MFTLGSPTMVEWLITDKCNLKCKHCSTWTPKETSDQLSLEETDKIIDQLIEARIFSLILSGGEPMLNENVYHIIKRLRAANIKVNVPTNGVLITHESALKLKEAGVNSVQVSIDGACAETHDNFRGVIGSFNKAIEAVKILKDTGVAKVNISTSVSKGNINEISDILKIALDLEVDAYSLRACMPCGRGRRNYSDIKLSPLQWKEMLEYLIENKKKLKGKLDFFTVEPLLVALDEEMQAGKDGFNEINFSGCGCGKTGCAIWPNGKVTPCSYLDQEAGNILNNTLTDIWKNSKVFAQYRDFNELVKGDCLECSWKYMCAGGCKARSYGEFGTPAKTDPLCWLKEVDEACNS